MKPTTTLSEFPDFSWELIVLFSSIMVLDGALSSKWLIREAAALPGKGES